MIEWLENIDRILFLWLNGFHNDFFDAFFWCVTSKYFGLPFYVIVIWMLIRKYGWKTGAILIVGAILSIALSDLSSNHLFKNIFLRYRPGYNLEIGEQVHNLIVEGARYRGKIDASFLSAHAANMFAIATFVGFSLNRKVLWIGFLVAALIGYSRIYIGVHYPADICCGSILGLFLGWLMYRFFSNLLTLSK